jgi:hypothetical protein
MHQPVDQGRGHGVVHLKGFAPVPEGSIRGDHDRSQFTTGGDNLEQQIGSTLVDGQIVQLIEEENTANQKTFNVSVLIYHLSGIKTKNETDFLVHRGRRRRIQG